MKRENEYISWNDNKIIEYAVENGESHLLIAMFKERPEALKHLYTMDLDRLKAVGRGEVTAEKDEQPGKLFHYLRKNPEIAFRLLQHSFPDVINRMWFYAKRKQFNVADVVALQEANSATRQPYIHMHRRWIDPALLAEAADDEPLARELGRLFNALDPHRLPHAQYCFLSTAVIKEFISRLMPYVNVTIFQETWSLQQKWISPMEVTLAMEKLGERGPPLAVSIQSSGALAQIPLRPLGTLPPTNKWGAIELELNNDQREERLVLCGWDADVVAVKQLADDENAAYVLPDWKEPTLDHLEAITRDLLTKRIDGPLSNENFIDDKSRLSTLERNALTKLLEDIDAARLDTADSDPRLHEYLENTHKGGANTLYQLYFGEKQGLWWEVLFAKIEYVEQFGVTDYVVFPREGSHRSPNGHRIFQCRCCGEETHNVDTETGSFFCNQKCMNAYVK